MIRHAIDARRDWVARVEAIGLDFHTINDAPYWDETAYWQFTAEEIDILDDAAVAVHRLAIEATGRLIREGRLGRLGIMGQAAELATRSWMAREPGFYGRFDVAWTGDGPPKFLEYNADTPTSLFEASVVQWHWLEERFPEADQFNSLHEHLVAAWRALATRWAPDDVLHLASMVPHPEDEGTVRYLRATVMEAGIPAKFVALPEIGWDGAGFVDLDDQPIRHLFKLYPWEWLAPEPFARHIPVAATQWLEPAWKLVTASKGLLAAMWEMFPDHPNLLPTAFRRTDLPSAAQRSVVQKPLFSREGGNVSIYEGNEIVEATPGNYGSEGFVWQQWAPLAAAGEDCAAVLGLWMVADRCCGMGIREDVGTITRDSSRFVPHLFT